MREYLLGRLGHILRLSGPVDSSSFFDKPRIVDFFDTQGLYVHFASAARQDWRIALRCGGFEVYLRRHPEELPRPPAQFHNRGLMVDGMECMLTSRKNCCALVNELSNSKIDSLHQPKKKDLFMVCLSQFKLTT